MIMDDSYYRKLVEDAKKSRCLYHFTNFESLKIILKNHSFRLSRLDALNDPAEAKRIDDFRYNKVFSFSFCNDDNINFKYFWNNYAKVEDIGMCLVIKNFGTENIETIFTDSECKNKMKFFKGHSDISYKSYSKSEDWVIYNVLKANILYVDNINKYVATESVIFKDDLTITLSPGLIKKKQGYDISGNVQVWEKENEQRVRVAIRPKGMENVYNKKTNKFEVVKPNFKYLYFKIPSEIIKIIINPNVPEKTKECVTEYIHKINSNIVID